MVGGSHPERQIAAIWSEPPSSPSSRPTPRPVVEFTLSHDSELDPEYPRFHTVWSARLDLRYEGGDDVAARPVEIAVADGAWVRSAGPDQEDWFEELDDSEGSLCEYAAAARMVGEEQFDALTVETIGVDGFWRGGGVGPLLLARVEAAIPCDLVAMEPGFVVARRRNGRLELALRARGTRRDAMLQSTMASWAAAGFARYPFECPPDCFCSDYDDDACARDEIRMWARYVSTGTRDVARRREEALLEAAARPQARAWHRRVARRLAEVG